MYGCHPFSPVADVDFDGTGLEATFMTGATNGATACTSITIIDDAAVEGDHSFTVVLSDVKLDPGGMYSGLTIGMSNSASVNIADNDGTVAREFQ